MPAHCLVCWRRLRATEAANRRRVAQQSRDLELSRNRIDAEVIHATKGRGQTADAHTSLPPLAVTLTGTPAHTVADCRAGRDLARKEDRLDALPPAARIPDAHQKSDFESPGRS